MKVILPVAGKGERMLPYTIIPPCVIGKICAIENSTMGPNVTLGDNCVVVSSMLENCIIWKGESVKNQEVTGQIIATVES